MLVPEPTNDYEWIDECWRSICPALIAVRRREQLPREALVSLGELRSSDEDYERLRRWAANVPGAVVSRCFRKAPHKLGAIFLLIACERGRREASEGTLWPHCSRGLFGERAAAHMFVQAQPGSYLKFAMEDAARRLGLRHVFDRPGVQAWYRCVYLQFGLTRRGLLQSLPEWLCQYRESETINDLGYEGSPLFSRSFRELWNALVGFRNGRMSEERLRERLRDSPWVLPCWADDLVRRARERPGLGSAVALGGQGAAQPAAADALVDEVPELFHSPRLRWPAGREPHFALELADAATWEQLGITDATYVVSANGRPLAGLHRQADGAYQADPGGDTVRLPLAPSATLTLRGYGGAGAARGTSDIDAIEPFSIDLWSEDEGVVVFDGDGSRFTDASAPLRANRTCFLLLPVGAVVDGVGEHPMWTLPSRTRRLHQICPDPLAELRVLIADDPVWTTGAEIPADAPRPDWARQVGVRQDAQRLDAVRVSLPEGVRLTRARTRTTLLDCQEHPCTADAWLASGVRPGEGPGAAGLWLRLQLASGDELAWVEETVAPWRQPDCALMQTEIGWEPLVERVLDVAEAADTRFRLFPPRLNDPWVLFEGDTVVQHGHRSRPSPIRGLSGLGAPLVLRHEIYNRMPDAPTRTVSRSVVRTGLVRRASVEDGLIVLEVCAPGAHRQYEPDDDHYVLCWDWQGQVRIRPIVDFVWDEDAGHTRWLAETPSGATGFRALGVGWRRACLGAFWKRHWHSDLTLLDGCEASLRAIRWLWLPVLAKDCSALPWANAHPAETLRAWFRDGEWPIDGRTLSLPSCDGQWTTALNRALAGWPACPEDADLLAVALDTEPDRLLNCYADLLRIGPRFLARAVRHSRATPIQRAQLAYAIRVDASTVHGGRLRALEPVVRPVGRATDEPLPVEADRVADLLAEYFGVVPGGYSAEPTCDPAFLRALAQAACRMERGEEPEVPLAVENVEVLVQNSDEFRTFLAIRLIEDLAEHN